MPNSCNTKSLFHNAFFTTFLKSKTAHAYLDAPSCRALACTSKNILNQLKTQSQTASFSKNKNIAIAHQKLNKSISKWKLFLHSLKQDALAILCISCMPIIIAQLIIFLLFILLFMIGFLSLPPITLFIAPPTINACLHSIQSIFLQLVDPNSTFANITTLSLYYYTIPLLIIGVLIITLKHAYDTYTQTARTLALRNKHYTVPMTPKLKTAMNAVLPINKQIPSNHNGRHYTWNELYKRIPSRIDLLYLDPETRRNASLAPPINPTTHTPT